MFHLKLTNPSRFVESTKISSEEKYDIHTNQNISTMRSKRLYELRATISKYTPRLVQLLDGSGDLSLPTHL
jgi:hypothetical protein